MTQMPPSPFSSNSCDIADQNFGAELKQTTSATSLDDFSDASTVGNPSDLETGLGQEQPEDEGATCGWPQVGAFVNSCDSFGIYRKFGQSHARILSVYMAEITILEAQIDELDQKDSECESTLYRLKTTYHREGLDATKRDLLAKLEQKLLAYNTLLLQHQQVKSLAPTPTRDHESVFRWFWKHQPVDLEEYSYLLQPDDFVTLVPAKRNRFEEFIRGNIELRPISWLKPFLRSKQQPNGSNDPAVQFFSVARINIFGRLIVVFFAVTVLFVPVILFLLTSMSRASMSFVVLAFVFVFSIMMSLLTDAGIPEIFVGTATYCAVIVTFLGNLQNNGG
ncbi:hypothetical protein LSUE1_G007072 [Lachnellula suecica]|uniref:DUF6594 domain-containing protein n=1 Tax=Lachnellula suecica TaxID=602035 RepID=A0A8T9C643_9HELO|nr:hypothetical protein LSUE1_G007072 [Lachnellula suecica]